MVLAVRGRAAKAALPQGKGRGPGLAKARAIKAAVATVGGGAGFAGQVAAVVVRPRRVPVRWAWIARA